MNNMKQKNKFLILVALWACTIAVANAQISTSPYSKAAYGLLSDNASGIQRSMGGVGYAMQGGRVVNAMNPASYAHVDSLTFLWDIGLDFTNVWSKESGNTGYNFGGGLDYITAQFRVAPKLGMSFGLLPYSSVGYTFGGSIDNGTEAREGTGGIAQIYLGAGYEFIKGLSVGANVSYMFGTTSNATTVTSTSTTLFQRQMQVRDWNLNVGLQYGVNIGHDRLNIGMVYSPKKSFHGHTWGITYDSQDTKQDTIGYTSLSGKYEQPHTFGAGLSYTFNRKLTAEVDFTYQNWADVKYTPLEGFESADTHLDNRWKLAGGLQYTPNRRGSYVGAMNFRCGAFYNHDYMNLMGNNVRDYGASVGVGLPVPNGKTTVNLGLEWRHRTSSPTVLITEDYFNITLSVNFNELWFWKNKIR